MFAFPFAKLQKKIDMASCYCLNKTKKNNWLIKIICLLRKNGQIVKRRLQKTN